VAIATCSIAQDPDEPLLLDALGDAGVGCRVSAWDDPNARWDDVDLVVVRSTWDYVARRDEFCAWAATVPRIANPAAILEWNTDKSYLGALAARSVPVVETRWFGPGEEPSFFDEEFVVKPAISVGGRDSARFAPSHVAQARRLVGAIHASGRAAMVQPYLASVVEFGEHALMYLGGLFSHSIAKGPLLAPDDPADNLLPEHQAIGPHVATPAERALAEATLGALDTPGPLLYARVDVVAGPDGDPLLLELELTEPFLFLSEHSGAPERFASAIVEAIEAAARD
jgi:hypothetical protein